MKLSQLLLTLQEVADQAGLSQPFLVGGVPRDKVAGQLNKLNDLDITTGDNGSHYLAKEVSLRLKSFPHEYQILADNHARLVFGDLKLDFSSNFNIPNIEQILQKLGISNPSEMEKEVYSRDFTCNTLLMPMDLKTIQDTLGRAVPDIQNKVLRTCLPPSISLGYDHKRVVRAIYLAAKLDFTLHPAVSAWIAKNPQTFSDVPPEWLSKKLRKAFKFNPTTTIKLLTELNLLPYTPPLPELRPYL